MHATEALQKELFSRSCNNHWMLYSLIAFLINGLFSTNIIFKCKPSSWVSAYKQINKLCSSTILVVGIDSEKYSKPLSAYKSHFQSLYWPFRVLFTEGNWCLYPIHSTKWNSLGSFKALGENIKPITDYRKRVLTIWLMVVVIFIELTSLIFFNI